MYARLAPIALGALLICGLNAHAQQPPAQQPPAGGQPNAGPGGGGNRGPQPTQTDRYKSDFVKLGGNIADGLLYEPSTPGANSRVAIVTTYDPPAMELASRGYRTLLVRHQNHPGDAPSPLAGAQEISRGIDFMRKQPGVQHVVVAGWGGGATLMILYVDIAERGPAGCQGKQIIFPCTTEEATGLAKPDGVVLFDPALGGAYKVLNIDPAYEGNARTRKDLDIFSTANGYDAKTGTANYSADFRKRYFAAQSTRNDQIVDDALAQLKQLDAQGPTADAPLVAPGGVNAADVASLHHVDLNLLSHTKKPHTLLKADGSQPQVVIHSIRDSTGPIGEDAIEKAEAQNDHPRDHSTVRQYLANDAVRTTKDYALTEDDVLGIDWKSSNTASPAQAEGITVPTLVTTNTCFQFVVPSEIVFNHLAAKDKTYVGLEGSTHFFAPCQPQYGDTRKRLFDFVDTWLGKPGRF